MPLPVPGARLARGLDRLHRHAAVERHLQPPVHLRVGVLDQLAHVLVVGVHPQLAARRVDDRPRQPVVVGVRVRAHQQPHVLQAQPGLAQRQLQLGERPRLVHAGVEQHDAVARRHRPRVAVRDAGPRERQAQPPDPGQDPVGPGQLLAAAGPGAEAVVAHCATTLSRARDRRRSRNYAYVEWSMQYMATQGTTVQIEMPTVGESVNEGIVLEWLVKVGDTVAEGDDLVEMSTDKVDAPVPSTVAGVVTKLLVEVDETVTVGQALCEIEAGDAPAAPEPSGNGSAGDDGAPEGGGEIVDVTLARDGRLRGGGHPARVGGQGGRPGVRGRRPGRDVHRQDRRRAARTGVRHRDRAAGRARRDRCRGRRAVPDRGRRRRRPERTRPCQRRTSLPRLPPRPPRRPATATPTPPPWPRGSPPTRAWTPRS